MLDVKININNMPSPMGESTSDWENYCRQEGLDTQFILSAMRKERKERRLSKTWREKINLARKWMK